MSLCANAQLTVFENGNVQVGNDTSVYDPSYGTLDISRIPKGSTDKRDAVGSITFGSLGGAKITGYSAKGLLNLYAGRKLEIGVSEISNALSINGSDLRTSSYFPISAPSFLTSSDARLKTNVQSLSEMFSGLQDVNPVSYSLSSKSPSDPSMMSAKDSDVKAIAVDERMHFGFIAQKIQKIYPNLVVEDEEGMLAIDYTGFIPLLVEAYKELSIKVKEQEEVIAALIGQKGPSYMPASVNGLAESKAALKQNKPNPFNTSTSIECTVPQNVASAFICVYDLQGKQVLKIDIRERGDVVNMIDASSLVPGMYIYTLITDGVEIDSKRMIITD